jgi:hypothetical protein
MYYTMNAQTSGKIRTIISLRSRTMANKKKIEERQQALDRQRTQRTIQTIGGAVLFLIVIGILWLVFSGNPAEETAPPDGTGQFYSAAPPMSIDTNKQYIATFKMENGGEFKVNLYADKTPITVNNFVFLARDGFYDGTTFHRVLDGFMAQGRPRGNRHGRPRLSIRG